MGAGKNALPADLRTRLISEDEARARREWRNKLTNEETLKPIHELVNAHDFKDRDTEEKQKALTRKYAEEHDAKIAAHMAKFKWQPDGPAVELPAEKPAKGKGKE